MVGQRYRYPIVLGILIALCLVAGAPAGAADPAPSPAAKPAAASGDQISLDFKDVELADLIQTISELTGKNFLYDDTVKGKVTIISPRPMSLREAYQLFVTVLNSKGFTLVPTGQANKIVPIRDAKESTLPVVSPKNGGPKGEQFVTRLVPLKYVDASDMATTVLTPLIPKTSNIIAFAPSNMLVITDTSANIDRLIKIIGELDAPTTLDQLEIFSLQFAGAEEVSKILTDVVGGGGPSISRRARAATNVQTAGAREATKIIPYPRTNAVVVLATAEDLQVIREMIGRLDQQPTTERSNINVYYLENADAETLAGTLNEILTGIRAQARGAQAAQAAATPAVGTKTPLSQGPVSITADKPTNSLILNASPEDFEILKEIIARLDIKRKQVYVEALILELSLEATQDLGVSLQGAADVGSDSLVFGTSNLNSGQASLSSLSTPAGSQVPSLLSQSINGLLLGGLFNPITVDGPDGNPITVPALSVLIDLSKTSSDVNILSAPRLLTSDNEEAEIIVGSNVPIITNRLTDTGGSGGLAQSVAVERQDVALTLRFTPQVTEGNLVRLNVFQEITDIATNSVGNINEVGPTLTKRQLRNTVLAEDGKTVVLGGLIGTNIQKTASKVPLLGDLPLLGWLFRSEGTQERKTNLLVFITPKVIRTAEDLANISNRSRQTARTLSSEELKLSIPPGTFLIQPDVTREESNP